jgi:DNA-binding transcriptional regulator YiaG
MVVSTELDELMNQLRAWAEKAPHGERKKLAQWLEVPEQRVSTWITGRKFPNARDALRLQTFLKKQPKPRKMTND